MIWGLLAYLMWGVFPAFFPLLRPAEPLEILAHRFVWTLLFVALILLLTTGFTWMRQIPAAGCGRRRRGTVAGTGEYIYAVNNDHRRPALGYFINPGQCC